MPLPLVIAIVDDDPEVRDALCDLLLVEGLECRAFESAEAFLGAYSAGVFASVITDLRMAGMSGLKLLASLKAADPSLPVIVVTSFADPQIQQQALERGASAVLIKPVRDVDLLGRLSGLLGEGKKSSDG